MDLDTGGVERNCFDFDAYKLCALQLFKHTIHDTCFGPAVHARVYGVPVTKALGQPTPFAAMLGHIEDCIDDLEVTQADVATLPRQAMLNGGELFRCDFHA